MEHFKRLYLKRDAWIFCCELFVSYPHSLYLLNMYMDGYFMGKEKKKSGMVFDAKESVWWLCKQGFFSGQPVDILVLDFFLTVTIQD